MTEVDFLNIHTISEGDDVPNYSEESDEEDEFQPSKQKEKRKNDFNPDFQFVGSTSEYNKDVWNDLAKYVKRKPTTKIDDKIAKAKFQLKLEKNKMKKVKQTNGMGNGTDSNENSNDSNSEIDDESEENSEIDESEENSDDSNSEIDKSEENSDDSNSEIDKSEENSEIDANEENSEIDESAENSEDQHSVKDEEEEEHSEEKVESDSSLSEDELVKDTIKIKEKRLSKKAKRRMKLEEEAKAIEFEELASINENISFYEMNISRPLLKAISAMNYIHPTPIQAATIPVALQGRDICGCAATGTGKTAAYMLPTLERLMYKPSQVASVTRVLVLVPTRELGVQVYQVTRQLAQFIRVEVALSVGGLDLKVQEAALRKSPDIVIATPGRLIDHLKNTVSFSLHAVEVLILDEADRMLDEYFQEQMTEIIRQCSKTRQTLLFSATMTDAVDSLAAVSLTKPVKVFVDNNQDVASNLRQEFIKVRKDKEGDREALLAALVCRTFHDHCMVFVQTKKQAHRIHILLGLLSVKVSELHGDLTQVQRLDALNKFRKEEVDVLVATDVAARGLDIPGVKTVINFVMPPTLEHYIHRVGRTARAGKGGVSVSLAGESERNIIKEIIKNSKIPVKARLIPPEIIQKYKKKIEIIESKIKQILDEEYEEKSLIKAELAANRAQNLLNEPKKKSKGKKRKKRRKKGRKGNDDSEDETRRKWFQTDREKRQEKERLRLSAPERKIKRKREDSEDEEPIRNVEEMKKKEQNKNKVKRRKEETADDRVSREIEKVALLQARIAKRRDKPKKLRTVHEREFEPKKNVSRKKKSSFAEELTDVSKKGVKSMRHEANKFKRDFDRNKKKNRNAGNKRQFKPKGGPRNKKS